MWPFKRKPEPPQPPINEDWRVGDLAECINNQPWNDGFQYRPGPEFLEVYKVADVKEGQYNGKPTFGLAFSRWPDYYVATAFRKITPRADKIERCDAKFLKSMKEIENV